MGQPTNAIMEFLDLYPTLIDYAGLEAPHALSGQSIRPILENPAHPGKAGAYTQVNHGNKVGRSVRNARWRYTEWDNGKLGIELYDHSKDTGEYYNLSGNPEYADICKAMKQLLNQGFDATKQ